MATLKQVWQVYKENGCEATVHRTIQAKLGTDSDAPAARAFLHELERLLSEQELLLLMLSIGLGGLYETQASFIGILLREEVLQPKMVDMLLEKLSEFSAEMDAQMMEKNIPKLILRELRWMDHVVDPQQLIEKLIGALPAFAPSLQRDIIYILPEIASDEDGLIVVDALLELIRSDAGLVICCIEALGNFNVLNEQTATVVQCVLERLDSSPLADLPAIVKYLVQEAPVTNIEEIVDQLREKLSSTLAFEDTAAAARRGKSGNEEALILGSIVQGFYFREELLKVFIGKIQATGPIATPLRLLDIWILIGAHSIPRHQDKMGKLLKKKVHTGMLSQDLMIQSITSHANALKSFFPSLLQLGSMLIAQTADESCVAMGSLLYELLFEEFSSRVSDESSGNQTVFYQGEVISGLLSHSLSRAAATKNAALDTLLALVSPSVSFHDGGGQRAFSRSPLQRRDRLRVFLPALKQMLDTMENCSAEEVRKIYDILFGIGGPEDPDLCNTLRKQAYHQDTRYRCFGILAAVSRMKRLLTFFRENSAEKETESKSANDHHERRLSQSSQVVTLSDAQVAKALSRALVELHESCLSHPKCLSFVLRELQLLVTEVDQDQKGSMLVEIISDYYTEVLLNQFMDDFDVERKHDGTYSKLVLDGAMKTDLWVGLDDKLSPVYLKILDLVVSPNVSDQQSLMYLNPLIALLLSCARTKKQLADIECVLVCPLQMMERSVLQDLSGLETSAQNAVCSTLWHGINWIRSILNFFACEKKEYYAAKVAERLENLSLLESILLDEILPSCPSFTPPGTSTIGMDSVSTGAKTSGDGKKKVGRPSGKKRVSGLEDRKLLIQQSFISMRSEVVNILTSPRLQPGTGISMDPLSQGVANVLETPLIRILFSLFEHHVQKSCNEEKKRKSLTAFWNKISSQLGTSRSEEILEHQDEVQTVPQLLGGFYESGVLDGAGRFAAYILAATESDQARGESEADEETDQATLKSRLQEYKSILVEYLKTVGAVLNYGIENGESSDSGPDVRKVQQLQALILASHDRVEYPEDDANVLQQIVKKCFKVIIRYHRVVGDNLDFAVALLKCLISILSLGYGFDAELVLSKSTSIDLNGWQQRRASLMSAIAAKISSLALSYLQTDWSRGDGKFVYKNAHLEVFLNGYLRHSAVVLDSIQTLAIDGFLEVLEHNGKRVENFPTLDKKTVGVYHRVMFSTLVAVTSRLDIVGGPTASDVKFVFSYLTQAVLLFKLLVCMTKSFQKSMIMASVLKVGRKFIEMILRVMPFFQEQFLVHSERVIKLISELQVATRRMQVLCAHGKLIKDQSAASQVPMVKKLLEKLIYRSEELASANGVLDAYTTGVLKNRRIDGTTISKEELEAGSESESDENGSETEEEERHQEEEEEEEEKSEEEAAKPAARKKRANLIALAQPESQAACPRTRGGKMKSICSTRVLVNKKRTSFSSSSSSVMMDAAAKEELAALSIAKEPAVHHGRMKVSASSSTSQSPGAVELVQDVIFTIGTSGVYAVAELGKEAVYEAPFEEMKEIVWDHSEKSVKFAMLDGQVSPMFFFKALSLVEGQIGQVILNPALQRRPEHAYMGVLAGKTLPSPIQQRRPSASLIGADSQQIVLPAAKRRELLHQERPARNAITRERLGMEYFRNGYLSFTCSINNDLRGLKLDLSYISVFPSTDCHDRSACLFSYLYENVDTCEAIGTRVELRFRRSGTKQPTYIALQSVEAHHIREAIWYLQHGTYLDASLRVRAVATCGLGSSSPERERLPTLLSSSITPRRQSGLAYFEDDNTIQHRIETRCRVMGCQRHSESVDVSRGSIEISTSNMLSQSSLSHVSRGVSTTRAENGRFCEEHSKSLGSPRSPFKRGAFFSRERSKSSLSLASSLIHSAHYPRMLRYQSPLLKKSGVKKFHLTKSWNVKYVVVFETPVGGFLCYYDKIAHCPGVAETPKERRVIDLSSVICIRPESSATNAPTSLTFDVVTIYRTWTFAATEPEEYEVWLKVLADAVEKHTSMAPDKRLKFPVKMMTTTQASQYQPTRHDSTTMEVSSYGVCVCSRHEGETEIYSWYFTEIQKWSVVYQQGEVCCLLSCLSAAGKSGTGPIDAPASSPYHEFLLQSAEAAAICQAIEFYVGKCMAKLEVLAIGFKESSNRGRRGSGDPSTLQAPELVRFKSEQIIKSSPLSVTGISTKKEVKPGQGAQTQHVIAAVPLKLIGILDKDNIVTFVATNLPQAPTGSSAHESPSVEIRATAQPSLSHPGYRSFSSFPGSATASDVRRIVPLPLTNTSTDADRPSDKESEFQIGRVFHSEILDESVSAEVTTLSGNTQEAKSEARSAFEPSAACNHPLIPDNESSGDGNSQIPSEASVSLDESNHREGCEGDGNELPLLEESFSSLTGLAIEMTPRSPVPIADLSLSPVPLLESPLFARSGRSGSIFSDTAHDETASGNGGGNDDDDDDSGRFVSFDYLECDIFEAPYTIDDSPGTCDEAAIEAVTGSHHKDQAEAPVVVGESVLRASWSDDSDTSAT